MNARRVLDGVRMVLVLVTASLVIHVFARVGTFTEERVGPISSLLLGVVAPIWGIVCFPSWFAFRIALPMRLRRCANLACWFSPLVRRGELPSVRMFIAVAAGDSFPPLERVPADAWTALASALQADRQGNRERVRLIVEALRQLPRESEFPWLARCHGMERLLLRAWDRGDFASLIEDAPLGRGRVAALLPLLVRAVRGEAASPRKLWLAWACLPARRRIWGRFRSCLERGSRQSTVARPPTVDGGAVREEAIEVGVRSRHLSLLSAASEGVAISGGDVLSLTRAWQEVVDKAGMAKLLARALELDARDATDVVEAVRDGVVGELVALAAYADTDVRCLPTDGDLACAVTNGVREMLCRRVEAAVARLRKGETGTPPHPLPAFEEWLELRAALDRLARQDGAAAMALWSGQVGLGVWQWTCTVFERHGRRAAWLSHIVYSWIAAQAELAGDMRAMVTNQENARVALRIA